MRKLASLAIALLVVCSSQNALSLGSPAPVTKKSHKALSPLFAHYIRGILYDSQRQFDRAIEEYVAAKELDPASAIIHKKLAVDYLRAGEYKEAEEELLIVKELAPDDLSARWFLAHFYTAQKDFAKATVEYEELLDVSDEDTTEILASLADLYVVQEKFDEAIDVYNKIIKENPDSAQAYFDLGIIFTRIEELDNAQKQFKTALEIDPEYLQAELALALLAEIDRNLLGAIEHYKLALEIDPLNIAVYHRLAQTYYRDKRVKDAISQYEFILQLNPHDVDAFMELGYIYLIEKETTKCIELLEEALKHQDDWRTTVEAGYLTAKKIEKLQKNKESQVYLILGLAYAQDKQNKKAITSYKKSITAESDNGLSYFYLGAIYEQNDQRKLAYENLKKSIELDKDNPDALNYLGYMYAVDAINLDEAEELIKTALEIEPDNGAYIDSLGWIYFKKGMLDKAQEQIEAASKILDDAEIFEHLGDVYQAKGLMDEALRAYARALELDTEREAVKEKLENLKKEQAKNVTE